MPLVKTPRRRGRGDGRQRRPETKRAPIGRGNRGIVGQKEGGSREGCDRKKRNEKHSPDRYGRQNILGGEGEDLGVKSAKGANAYL